MYIREKLYVAMDKTTLVHLVPARLKWLLVPMNFGSPKVPLPLLRLMIDATHVDVKLTSSQRCELAEGRLCEVYVLRTRSASCASVYDSNEDAAFVAVAY